jgi:hypothetical protein
LLQRTLWGTSINGSAAFMAMLQSIGAVDRGTKRAMDEELGKVQLLCSPSIRNMMATLF